MLLNYSSANFVTIKLPKKVPMSLVTEYFEANGAVTRRIEDYRLFNCIRTSLGPANVNNLLIDSINNIDSMKVRKAALAKLATNI